MCGRSPSLWWLYLGQSGKLILGVACGVSGETELIVDTCCRMLRMADTRTKDVVAWYRSTSSTLRAEVLASQQLRENAQLEEFADVAT